MSSLDKSMESKFNYLKIAIKEERGKWLNAQGVNALIMVYPPKEEKRYLARAREDFSNEYFIDLSKLFVDFIDSYGINDFKELYELYRTSSMFIDESSEEKDLFDMIKYEIELSIQLDKIPILIRTGILYGTDIRNITILESSVVSRLKKPLIIFYPGKIKTDLDGEQKAYFLGSVKASDYRGHLF